MAGVSYGKIILSLLFLGGSILLSSLNAPVLKSQSPLIGKSKTQKPQVLLKSKKEVLKKDLITPEEQMLAYDLLIKNINKEVLVKAVNTQTYKETKIMLSGEGIFSKIKRDLSNGMIEKSVAKKKFKKVMSEYYKNNKNINFYKVQQKISIDLLNIENFYGFENLRSAFSYYQKAVR